MSRRDPPPARYHGPRRLVAGCGLSYVYPQGAIVEYMPKDTDRIAPPTIEPAARRDRVKTEARPSEPGPDPIADSQRAFLIILFNKYRGALLRHVERLVHSREDAAE